MPGLGIWQDCEYASIRRGADYTLRMPTREYALIMLNILKCAYISLNKHNSEYTRILNMFVVHSIRSLHKFLNSYRDSGTLRTPSNI